MAASAMSGVKVKSEPNEVNPEERIIQLCKQSATGISNQELENGMPGISVEQRVAALNKLLTQGQIELLKRGGLLIYKLKSSDGAANLAGADMQERMVYQAIEAAKTKGIWVRDIRVHTGLVMPQVNKALKSLESKKIVKAVKSVAGGKKKVYMLYNLTPDRSVTGGAWYSENEFEHEFVDVLSSMCLKLAQEKARTAHDRHADNPMLRIKASYVPSSDVLAYIVETRISNVTLAVEDIETILDTLVYDGKLESAVSTDEKRSKMYRAVPALIESTPLMCLPCGMCPVASQCHEGGVISPVNCVYLKEWLD